MRRTPYTTRRRMHLARHLSAVPHGATYHTTARGRATRAGRTHRLGGRDRAALERDGAILHAHHAAVVLRTSQRSHAHCNRPTHPVRRHPPPLRIAALAPHAPLLRCRISPRCRTARCPCPWRARRRRRRTAHKRIAPPLGRRNSPAFAGSGSAREARCTTHPTAVRHSEGCAFPMYR